MKKISASFSAVLLLVISAMIAATPSYAVSEKRCLCHNAQNNPHEVCSDDDSYKEGHENHLESGFDILGQCPVTTISVTPTEAPAVPEFGLLSGLVTVALSTGSYVMLKKRV